MAGIDEKTFLTEDGEISYFRAIADQSPHVMLFIHGLGADKKWFLKQFTEHSLDRYSWLVPDLLGFGRSAKPRVQEAYTMDNQAEILMGLLLEEHVENLVVLAHSMGGPIAVSLIERLSGETDVNIPILFYLEGNLDIDDAYLSGKFAALTFEEYTRRFEKRLGNLKGSDPGLYDETKAVGPLPYWASSVDLVRASGNNDLLPRIQKFNDLAVFFVLGARNSGQFPSEESIRQTELPLSFVPDAGHLMYLDNPGVFWKFVSESISQVSGTR